MLNHDLVFDPRKFVREHIHVKPGYEVEEDMDKEVGRYSYLIFELEPEKVLNRSMYDLLCLLAEDDEQELALLSSRPFEELSFRFYAFYGLATGEGLDEVVQVEIPEIGIFNPVMEDDFLEALQELLDREMKRTLGLDCSALLQKERKERKL